MAATETAAPGETVEITFTASQEPGEYIYVCTYLGQCATIPGKIRVENWRLPLEGHARGQLSGVPFTVLNPTQGVDTQKLAFEESRIFVPLVALFASVRL